ncbi:uncharacterized protein LOC127137913 [Lathyrus oleraceus]|uniref:uncharacterized protein LOC127137913 n=1 Tax=Pisum sativum TaxID=3888 RepID=UPI0021D3DF9A|nr:uncharacterized protein LOC127137913 [Pisum sativum]
MSLDVQFQISVIIDKLPPDWKDFKNLLRHKIKEFSIESLIIHLWIEEEAQRKYQKDEVLVISNNKKKFGAVLKPTGKPLKNQNHNVVNQIKNENPSRALCAPITRHQPPPQINDASVFTCFNYGKLGHMVKICKSIPKHVVGSNAQVKLTNEQFIDMITEINMVGRNDGWWIDNGAYRHNKSEPLDMFKMYVKEIENQFSKKIKRLRSDRGIEYNSGLFNEFYKQHEIVHETTASYSPKMNGKLERKNKTLIELFIAIMLNFGVAPH